MGGTEAGNQQQMAPSGQQVVGEFTHKYTKKN
jgi:hypothetical protein